MWYLDPINIIEYFLLMKSNKISSEMSSQQSEFSGNSSHESEDTNEKHLILALIQKTKSHISQLHQFQTDMVQPILKNPYLLPTVPDFDPNINYLIEMSKWNLCYHFSLQVSQDLQAFLQTIHHNIRDVEKRVGLCKWALKKYIKKKRRRTAIQIARSYKCPYYNCYRSYGSDVSLNLHIKIKHNGGNKTDRQKLAQQICQAEYDGLSPPHVDISFPPKFLDTQRAIFQKNLKSAVTHSNQP